MNTFKLNCILVVLSYIKTVEYNEGLTRDKPINDFKKILHEEKKAIICSIIIYDGILEYKDVD